MIRIQHFLSVDIVWLIIIWAWSVININKYVVYYDIFSPTLMNNKVVKLTQPHPWSNKSSRGCSQWMHLWTGNLGLIMNFHQAFTNYTLSHPENDRDITDRVQEYTLQDASFMRQSRCSFLNAWENTQVARAMTSVFLRNTRWRQGLSRGETRYSGDLFAIASFRFSSKSFYSM